MYQGSNIYTIHSAHNSAPPSYAETMQHSGLNSSDHMTTYNEQNSQMPSYPYPQSNQFYSHPVQPAYDTIYRTAPNQQIQSTSTTALTNTVITGRRAEKPSLAFCRICWATIVFIIALVIFVLTIQRLSAATK